jgi:hypothetical protein
MSFHGSAPGPSTSPYVVVAWLGLEGVPPTLRRRSPRVEVVVPARGEVVREGDRMVWDSPPMPEDVGTTGSCLCVAPRGAPWNDSWYCEEPATIWNALL